ncbi:MAG: class I SAM-dependent methyltransferase, partial [Candidatus Thiodiazotropha sp. (ex Myrtea spinifera)]|nr:class I SAM-dependent methyltransferase [Candidatus Thiodiazotropha sp. (ex Myrtea spinifera)]
MREAVEYRPTYLTSQTPWHGLIPFSVWLSILVEPEIICELGVYRGDSFFTLFDANKDRSLKKIIGIDTWAGDADTGLYGEGPFNQFTTELESRDDDRLTFRQSMFSDALKFVTDKSIDILHIDGAHDYRSVSADFTSWKNKVSNRGIILFHDISVLDRGFGVHKLWDELKEEFPDRVMDVSFSNGLGVLFIGDKSPFWLLKNAYSKHIAIAVELLNKAGKRLSRLVKCEHYILESVTGGVDENWVYGRYIPEYYLSQYCNDLEYFSSFKNDIWRALEDRFEQLKRDMKDIINQYVDYKINDVLDYRFSLIVEERAQDLYAALKEQVQEEVDDRVEGQIKSRDLYSELKASVVEEIDQRLSILMGEHAQDLYAALKEQVQEEVDDRVEGQIKSRDLY